LPGTIFRLFRHPLLAETKDNKYVFYQIESEYIQRIIALKKSGMGVPHLFQQDIKNFILLLPPLLEQQAIADYLDVKTAQIDRKIELLEQKAEKYADLKRSLINETVTHGLNKTIMMKDSGMEWLGQIPAHWELRRLKDLFVERRQKGYREEPLLIASQDRGVILKSDYSRNTMTVQQDFHLMKLVKKDDFVISLRSFEGGIEIANNQGIISAAYTILCTNNNFSVGYYKHLFKSKKFISMLTTNTTGIREGRNVNYQQLKRELLPLPSPEECKAIAEYLNDKTVKIDRIIETIHLEIEKLKELRKTLINDVVTGKIKVYGETVHE
jgi:type I restriction enzyme S subunit